MEKKYDHKKAEIKEIENFLLNDKESHNYYACLLPPPNITGKLHLGHMWECTIQDILLRFNYLQGKKIKWLVGLDHAGIATQVKVEKYLSSQVSNFKSSNYSREWLKLKGKEWFQKHKTLIISQWKKMGLLMELDKIAYTLEPEFNKLVVKSFVNLYQNGIIYKGKKMINWDIQLQTAISDLEVIRQNEKSKLYYLKYYLVENPKEYLAVATSRPETVFADACLFVNPKDDRYIKYVGKEVFNPASQKKIPVLANESVLIDFGTGILKCTPAHDFHDYELGIKHKLPFEVCLDSQGLLNELAGKYQGLDRFTGRKKLIQDLQLNDICFQIKDYETKVGYSQRSNTIIEPYLSTQWFLNYNKWIKEIEQKQQKTFEKLLAEIEFLPSQYYKKLIQWKADLKDWCLSRQLWWGHQIPVWYHKETGEVYAGEENPPDKTENWEQEEMVLDTWFSSGLIPIFHSIKNNKERLKLPIDILATGYDILFFWVFKMICFSYYFDEKKPFKGVLIHGLIRDSEGNKMSKSSGNAIDPEDLIEKYGADAIRLAFVTSQTQDQDIKIQDSRLKGSWRFLDKIWNIARFLEILMKEHNIKNKELDDFAKNHLSSKIEIKYLEKDYLHCHFLLIFRNLVGSPHDKKNSYNFLLSENKIGEAINKLKKFIVCEPDDELIKKLTEFGIKKEAKKDDFGNDYLEMLKIINDKDSVKIGLILFKYILRILNPFAPFLSSYLYRELYSTSLLSSEWDRKLLKELVKNLSEESLKKEKLYSVFRENCVIMSLFYEIVRKIREFRKRYSVKEKLIINLILLPMSRIGNNQKETYLTNDKSYEEKINTWLKKLVDAELNKIIFSKLKSYDEYKKERENLEKEKSVKCLKEKIYLFSGRLEIFVPENTFSQFEKKDKDIHKKETEETKLFLKREIARCEKLLTNEGFVAKAPKELIEKEREKLNKFLIYQEKLKSEMEKE